MMSSMTGFGRGETTHNGTTITVEIRSVNNRYCEVSLKTPANLSMLDQELKDFIQKRVDRGKLSVSVRVESAKPETPAIRFDAEAARLLHAELTRLNTDLGLNEPITLNHLLRFDAIYQSRNENADDEGVKSLLLAATEAAIADLQRMRNVEGQTLQADLAKRLDNIEAVAAEVETLAKARIPEARKKLMDRVSQLVASDTLDPNRLELEIALLADKLDITEELVRLASHISYFRLAMDAPEPAGRKLNFLIQEMNREVNTMGSKAGSAGIAHLVVNLKETLEIIREQIQNIE